MSYALKEPFHSKEFSNWSGVFESLSLDEFNSIALYLSFPFAVSEPVRQVGRDLFIARLRAYGPKPPFMVPRPPVDSKVDFLEGMPENLPLSDKTRLIFSSAFSELQELGYASTVYDWGSTTRLTYPPKNVDALLAWHLLLRNWLIVELRKGSVDAPSLDVGAAQRLMSHEFASRVRAEEHKLDLLAPTRTALQTIILKYEDEYLEFRTLVERLRTSSASPWTNFSLGYFATDSWLKNEGYYRLTLAEWRNIKKLLSASEIAVLEQWARQHTTRNQYKSLIVPMPDF